MHCLRFHACNKPHQKISNKSFFYSEETDMNPFSSILNHENHTLYEGHPLQGPPMHGGRGVFFKFFDFNPPRGRPIRDGGYDRNW
jgi:hypothetical protein